MLLGRKVDSWQLESYKKSAQDSYPDDDPSVALNKYIIENEIKGILFMDGDGERKIWGEGTKFSSRFQEESH